MLTNQLLEGGKIRREVDNDKKQSCLFSNFPATILKNLWKIGKEPSLMVNSMSSQPSSTTK